ncbi:hypothetical protein KAW65_02925 [candidate division WOR-3 bacterium]|nr:hypothetical protein [candidate division WOR-3 bacterium]
MVRELKRTPGKLITKKGPIGGYLSAFGEVWGKLEMTGDQAEKAMGFRTKEGAIGVVLSRRKYIDENGKVKKGIFATSLMPWRATTSAKRKPSRELTRVLSKIASNHISDIIHPIWEPLVANRKRKPWDGFHYFMGLNIKNIGECLDWSRLFISNGDIKPPERLLPSWYEPEKRQIHISLPKTLNWIGIGIFDIVTGSFFHISPEQIANRLIEDESKSWRYREVIEGEAKATHYWELKQIREYHYPWEKASRVRDGRFYIYNYYKRKGTYSPSISGKVRVCKNRRVIKSSICIFIDKF